MITNPVTANPSPPLQRSASAQSPSSAAAEKNMFMSLLVAQLKNQDPLAPQDGTAFVAQLAQFNSLDQLIGIRESLDRLNTLLQEDPPPPPVPLTK